MKYALLGTLMAALLALGAPAWAHTPLFSCYGNGDNTITCEGGFSDGSSAAGVTVFVLDGSGKVLNKTALDEYSEITVDKPAGAYTMRFDAGEGHQIDVAGKDIVD